MGQLGLKEMTRSRALKLGHYVMEFATPGIGHVLKNAGCEFAVLDVEHSGLSSETVKASVQAFAAAGLPLIVSVGTTERHDIARALDLGAEGIMVPMVQDVAEAQRFVAAAKYTPAGNRVVALGVAHDRYTGGPVAQKLAAANARTTLFAKIETPEGVEAADAILALPEIDGLWLGYVDLSCAMGIPGAFDDPRFVSAVARLVAAARKHGKSLGRIAANAEEAVAMAKDGFDFLCYSGDIWLLGEAIRAGCAEVRARLEAG